MKLKKLLSAGLSLSIVMGMVPVTSLAAETAEYKDGTYGATATVEPDEDEDFDAYDIKVNVTITGGKVTAVEYADTDKIPQDSVTYADKAMKGTKSKAGVAEQIIINNSADNIDVVSSATCSSDAIQSAVKKALEEAGAAASEPEKKDIYVLMNIPYDEFYQADVNNSIPVDAMSSATKNKTRTSTLAGGSYHINSDGSDITGITFPVKVSSLDELKKYTQITDSSSVDITVTNRGQTTTTTYTGKDALFESGSYSYYVLNETPSYYKELTVGENGTLSFGKTIGTEQQVSGAGAALLTDTTYGDYQLNMTGLSKIIDSNDPIYGVIITTTDGSSYGLRHLENIWLGTELAWCTGYTDKVHNCPTSSEHYKSMMGKTIDKVTYYTSDGIYVADIADIYVPEKFSGSVTVADAALNAGKTSVVMNDIPGDFQAEYSVEGLEAQVSDGVLTFSGDAEPGTYILTVKDKSGKYADLKVDFTLTTDKIPAAFDQEKKALTAAEGSSADDLSNYVGNIVSVSVNGKAYSASGRGAVQIINDDGTLNLEAASGGSAVFGDAGTYKIEVTATGYTKPLEFNYTLSYKYVYAALSWAEYWEAENVYLAPDSTMTSASDEVDERGEADKGAFDVVSRATTNHGLHRGSFQSDTIIYDTDGKSYEISYWKDKNTIVLADGSEIGFDKGTITAADGKTAVMDHYEVKGLKYVPVAVKETDYAAFCEKYHVVENGDMLYGGYEEVNLKSYSVEAEVSDTTNGLKTVSKNEDGSFSFSARKNGSQSGISSTEQKKVNADQLEVTVKEADGAYGEFLRVDLTGEAYGDLGSNLQAVKWTYYGSDDSYSTPLVSYGTKFAADNWMHKSNGIQLGLTDSLRCQLPEGTDGTGYWALTVYAMGYEDYTFQIKVTDDNIVKADEEQVDITELQNVIGQAEALKEADYTAESWANMQTELQEAKDALAAPNSQAIVNEAIAHLQEAIAALVKVDTENPGGDDQQNPETPGGDDQQNPETPDGDDQKDPVVPGDQNQTPGTNTQNPNGSGMNQVNTNGNADKTDTEDENIVKTGDSTNAVIPFAAAMLALASAAGVGVYGKRKKTEE
ncbi:47 kDa membrane antigen precursor [uncultured Roseburia sp.]|uniref:FMN-binding protein n=1 Tax=Brotonthovivens ammoniilytica TaxID=2981725 RepID=A0ABT2TM07_9FIRM|nr:penicillin-binding Tp47 domain C-containing protein [Brotonthovivens ammoniilytica]MCU6762554.1 FMN-binding protein [Brotonthovivens ammoniilytica]SCI75477.1 47 kDa membrane antigen precursor [uncultured Roseburia sp.]